MNDDSDQGTKSVFRADYVAIGICFLLSGFAGLLYETVWLRQFAIVLGTSEQALAVILASYMGGLAVGAWVASRTVARVRRPVLTYGLLEAGIAICALLMPWGLRLVSGMHVQIFGGTPVPPAAGSLPQTLFGLASSFGLILLPTAMMGATLPLLTKYVVHHDREVGQVHPALLRRRRPRAPPVAIARAREGRGCVHRRGHHEWRKRVGTAHTGGRRRCSADECRRPR